MGKQREMRDERKQLYRNNVAKDCAHGSYIPVHVVYEVCITRIEYSWRARSLRAQRGETVARVREVSMCISVVVVVLLIIVATGVMLFSDQAIQNVCKSVVKARKISLVILMKLTLTYTDMYIYCLVFILLAFFLSSYIL